MTKPGRSSSSSSPGDRWPAGSSTTRAGPARGCSSCSPDGIENKHPETHDILPGTDWNSDIRVDDDGRFPVEGLVPGLNYGATSRTGFEAFGNLFMDVIVAPGEAKDLGDLKVQPPKKQEE